MKPLTIINSDALNALRGMASESVHCMVTSPPYWKLRDYKVKGQLGMEKTPELFLQNMTAVFSEARRVLRKDGTLWLNMGDSYNGAGTTGGKAAIDGTLSFRGKTNGAPIAFPGLKRKELCGMPWRLAFALQAEGWYLRSDIIWHKPNPMPESCKDRPTKSHEYIFLFSKSERYYYDHEAIREPVTGNAHSRGNGVNPKASTWKTPDGWDTSTGNGRHGQVHKEGRTKPHGKNSRMNVSRDPEHATRPKQNESFSAAVKGLVSSRNKRTVWRVATAPYPEAHFATFPPSLIRPCILAGTSEAGACSECGKPLKRVIKLGDPDVEHQKACGGDASGEYEGLALKDYKSAKAQTPGEVKARILKGMRHRKTVGWIPTCKCAAGVTPCVVLDMFGGSGTTGEVAIDLGRAAVLIELSAEYIPLIEKRCSKLWLTPVQPKHEGQQE